jgi:hypothetical protein
MKHSVSYRLESASRRSFYLGTYWCFKPTQCVQTEGHYLERKVSHKRFYSFQQADFDPSAVRQKGDCCVHKYLTQKTERFVNGV